MKAMKLFSLVVFCFLSACFSSSGNKPLSEVEEPKETPAAESPTPEKETVAEPSAEEAPKSEEIVSGTLVTGFGDAGIKKIPLVGLNFLSSPDASMLALLSPSLKIGTLLELDESGRIYAATNQMTAFLPESKMTGYLVRLLEDGSLDSSFGSQQSGQKIIDFGENITVINSMALQGSKLLVGGVKGKGKLLSKSSQKSTYVARLNNDGGFDTTFGSNKTGIEDVGFNNGLLSIDVLEGGSFLVSGMFMSPVDPSASPQCAVKKLALNANEFSPLGNNPILVFPSDGVARSVVSDALNSHYITCTSEMGGTTFHFDNAGVIKNQTPSNSPVAFVSIKNPGGGVLNAGMGMAGIWVGGLIEEEGKIMPDLGFGIQGAGEKIPVDSILIGQDMDIQADGKIVVAGFFKNGKEESSPLNGIIARYLPDGSLDQSFGAEKKGYVIITSEENEFLTSVRVSPKGTIFTGSVSSNEKSQALVIRAFHP